MEQQSNPFVVNATDSFCEDDEDETLQELEYTHRCKVVQAKTQIIQLQMDLLQRLATIATTSIEEDVDFYPTVEKTMNSISLIIDTFRHNRN